jgi:integrase/recombinase XerD
MAEDRLLANFVHRAWLVNSPLDVITTSYIDSLRTQRYADGTIHDLLSALAHFAHWMKVKELSISEIEEGLFGRFVNSHLPHCRCPAPCCYDVKRSCSALNHLLRVLRQEGLFHAPRTRPTPVSVEVDRFAQHLGDTCGLALSTSRQRTKYAREFLERQFGKGPVKFSRLKPSDVDQYFVANAGRWSVRSLGVIRDCLASYFRFRAFLGYRSESLRAALPVIANWAQATLPKGLTNAQLEVLLQSFDLTDPLGRRDYAIARCLIDLGLRRSEVVHLRLESFNWREGTITIDGGKGRRTRRLPLPVLTGKAVARYLRNGRPTTRNRHLFVRHHAPFDKPLGSGAICSAICSAYARCGLREQFAGTHVLRHGHAMRLQRSGASLKEIADLLGHEDLDATKIYAKVDLEGLRAVALPWPGSGR